MKPASSDGKFYFKARGADIRTEAIVIRQNAHKYSISAMCKCLGIGRSTYCYEASSKPDETELELKVEAIFHKNRDVYGSRKIKKELLKENLLISRGRICGIMKKLGLVSSYYKDNEIVNLTAYTINGSSFLS